MPEVEHVFLNIPADLESLSLEAYRSYFNCVLKELDNLAGQKILRSASYSKIKTFYVATEISSPQRLDYLLKFLAEVLPRFEIVKDAELSLEILPATYPGKAFDAMAALGFKRLVFKVYSFIFQKTQEHKFLDLQKAIERALKSGIEKFSVDMKYNYPGESLEDLRQDFSLAISLPIKHVYISDNRAEAKEEYLLQTAYQDSSGEKVGGFTEPKVNPFVEDQERVQYHKICEGLQQQGFQHYELFAFTRGEENQSRHNLSYWRGESYLGLGAGATGFVYPYYYQNPQNIAIYQKQVQEQEPYTLSDVLGTEDLELWYFILAINDLQGFKDWEYQELTNRDFTKLTRLKLSELVSQGLLERQELVQGSSWKLTNKGLDYSDDILQFLAGE